MAKNFFNNKHIEEPMFMFAEKELLCNLGAGCN